MVSRIHFILMNRVWTDDIIATADISKGEDDFEGLFRAECELSVKFKVFNSANGL